jgi:glycine/D-amino acid oxidase-like deaminating enzyme
MRARGEADTGAPVWLSQADSAPMHRLDKDVDAAVCVIGAGVSGLSVAYELACRGTSVVVLEAGMIGGGQTCRTTAHLVTALDERYFLLHEMLGAEAAGLAAKGHHAAIDRVQEIVRQERIDCGFARLDGVLVVPPERASIADELLGCEAAACTRFGVAVERFPEIPQLCPSFALPYGPCLVFPGQAQVHPLRYLDGLARAVTGRGGRVFTDTRVSSCVADGAVRVSTTNGHTINAGSVVIATQSPIGDSRCVQMRMSRVRSYVVAMRLDSAIRLPNLLWDGYWTDDTPYHYVRTASAEDDGSHDLLIVGGEDHAAGEGQDSADRYRRLESWARERYIGLGPVTHRWYGEIMEPDDELAFIGHHPSHDGNVYIITGDSGNGMTYAAIAGLMLPDMIAGRPHPWEALYSPSRRRFTP